MKLFRLFILVAAAFTSQLLSSCADSCDKIDTRPSVYDGPHGGEHHQKQEDDEDYCDCLTGHLLNL